MVKQWKKGAMKWSWAIEGCRQWWCKAHKNMQQSITGKDRQCHVQEGELLGHGLGKAFGGDVQLAMYVF